jgi:hypothetical protein
MSAIRTISLWQPWASLCFADDPELRKLDETRHWPLPAAVVGQRIAIHAALRAPANIDEGLASICDAAFGADWRKTLPRGSIIGTLTLGECRLVALVRHATTAANLAAGNFDDFTIVKGVKRPRFAWALHDPMLLPAPIPEKGKQGWWTVPGDRLGVRAGNDLPLFNAEVAAA